MKKIVEVLAIRQVGGTRGRGKYGINFGQVGDPKPNNLFGVDTTVEHRSGSLVQYAVEYAKLRLNVGQLISILSDGWDVWTMDKVEIRQNDVFKKDDPDSWVIPRGHFFNGSPVGKSVSMSEDLLMNWYSGVVAISNLTGDSILSIMGLLGFPTEEPPSAYLRLSTDNHHIDGIDSSGTDVNSAPYWGDLDAVQKELKRLRKQKLPR